MKIRKILPLSLAAIVLFFYQIGRVSAQQSALPSKTSEVDNGVFQNSTTSIFPLLLQTIVALLLIIGFIYLLFRFLNKRQHQFFGRTFVRPLGGCSLGPQKSLQVVQIGSSIYIVGVGENVQLIRHIEDPEEIENLLDSMDAQFQNGPMMTTPDWLANLLKKVTYNRRPQSFENTLQEKMDEAKRQREWMKEELFEDREKGHKE
ncbi:flagellar biosynthetic protein FliO [Aneurinibacillus terranovensis]|uniref:flagellar biosynthetic protein FliO n=1 Tax=Aneurinibacillus terranovensis TaxID=278991 RepID=UPI000688A24F|nr:flagellar biosynthetic protein FliO [Aneurinibacillus terranovensis]